MKVDNDTKERFRIAALHEVPAGSVTGCEYIRISAVPGSDGGGEESQRL